MLRTILGAILGYCFIGLLIMVTDRAYALAICGMSTLKVLPAWYYILAMLTDTIYYASPAAGCAPQSRAEAPQATIGLITPGEVMGVASTIYLWNTGAALLQLLPADCVSASRLVRSEVAHAAVQA